MGPSTDPTALTMGPARHPTAMTVGPTMDSRAMTIGPIRVHRPPHRTHKRPHFYDYKTQHRSHSPDHKIYQRPAPTAVTIRPTRGHPVMTTGPTIDRLHSTDSHSHKTHHRPSGLRPPQTLSPDWRTTPLIIPPPGSSPASASPQSSPTLPTCGSCSSVPRTATRWLFPNWKR